MAGIDPILSGSIGGPYQQINRIRPATSLPAFAFMGHITGRHIEALVSETAPAVASKPREDGVDIAFLTPA